MSHFTYFSCVVLFLMLVNEPNLLKISHLRKLWFGAYMCFSKWQFSNLQFLWYITSGAMLRNSFGEVD